MAIMFVHAVRALRRTSPTGFNDPLIFYPNASDECGVLIFRQMSAQTKRMNATTYVHLLRFPLAEHTHTFCLIASYFFNIHTGCLYIDDRLFELSSPVRRSPHNFRTAGMH